MTSRSRELKSAEHVAAKRRRGAAMASDEAVETVRTLKLLLERAEKGERPPPHVKDAIDRYASDERRRVDKLIIHTQVVNAIAAGAPRDLNAQATSSFEIAAAKMGVRPSTAKAAFYELQPKRPSKK